MNKALYQVIFNKKRGHLMVVSESAKREGKGAGDGLSGAASPAAALGFASSTQPTLLLRSIPFSVMLALGGALILASPDAQAQASAPAPSLAGGPAPGIRADKNAPAHQQPDVTQTSNGLPQVNIQTPSAKGVSMNQYSQFDVAERGAILNNAAKDAQTQLAGWVQANPNLAGGEARIIVNQVNSADPSQLRGYIEVAGRRAEVIIANPSGIMVNGGGFINASNVTLSTGKPIIEEGDLKGHQVRVGIISIEGKGLDTTGADYTQLLAKAAEINAGIWGKDIRIVTGSNNIDAQGNATAVADNGPKPQVAIDTGELGGMYAGKITLVSNDKGVGVNNAGQILAGAGGVSIDADGNLVNSGAIASQGNAELNTAGLDNTGTLAAKELRARNQSRLANQGTISAERLDIETTSLNNQGEITQTGLQGLNVEANRLANLNGGMIGLLMPEEEAAQDTPGVSAGSGTGSGTGSGGGGNGETGLDLTPGQLIVREDYINDGGQLGANGGVNLTLLHTLENSGTLLLNQLNAQGALLDNRQGVLTARLADIQVTRVDNREGEILLTGHLDVQAQHIANEGGSVLSHSFEIGAQSIVGGTFTATGSGKVSFTGDAHIEADFMSVGNLGISAGGTLTNRRTLEAGNSIQIEATHIDNTATGVIQANNLTKLTSQSLTNYGLINSNGLTHIQTEGLLENLGTGRIYGDYIAIEAGKLSNLKEGDKAAVIAAREQLHIGVGQLENRDGAALASEGFLAIGGSLDGQLRATGRAQLIDNPGGEIRSGGDMRLGYEQLNNTNPHFRTEVREIPGSRQRFVEYVPKGWTWDQRFDSSRIARFGGENGIHTTDGKHYRDYTKYAYDVYETETFVVTSTPGQIIAGGMLVLDGESLINDKSQILANGIFGDTHGVENLDAEGKKITVTAGTSQYFWQKKLSWYKGGGYESRRHSPVPYRPGDVEETFSLDITQYDASAGGVAPGLAPSIERIETETGEVRTTTAQTHLPDSSWFTINLENGNRPLIETDPAYTQNRAWVSSDFLFDGLGLDALLKRLGDGYYEQRLVAEQIARLTGKSKLDGYGDNEAQFLALMANALIEAQSLGLVPGLAPSAAQLSQLTRDIVWMVEQRVTLPDGSHTQALVPQVYIVTHANAPDGTHSMIAANSIQLNVGGLHNNAALIGHDFVSLNTQNLHNTGGTIQGNAVVAQAEGDITNIGGQIIARDAVLLEAGNDIISASTTRYTENLVGRSSFTAENIDQVGSILVTGADGLALLQAGNNIQLTGSLVASAGDIRLRAGGDIKLDTVDTHWRNHGVADADNQVLSAQSQEVGTLVQAQGNVVLEAGNDISLRASDIDSVTGSAVLTAGNDITLDVGRATTEDLLYTKNSHSGLLSSSTTIERFESASDTSIASNVTGAQVQFVAGQGINVTGSNVISDLSTTFVAGRDVNIVASQDFYSSYTETIKKTSGLMGTGGIGFTIGQRTEQLQTRDTALVHAASIVGSLGGDTLIVAENGRYQQTGSLVSSPKGDVGILAQGIDIVAAKDQYTSWSLYQYEQSGVTVALNVPIVSLLQNTAAVFETVGKSNNGRVNAMAAANAGWNTYQSAGAVGGAMSGGGSPTSGISISITYGEQRNKSEQHIEGFTASASQVSAGGGVSLIATGAGEGSNITITGSDVAGKGGTWLEADNQINLLAFEQGHTERGTNQSQGFNFGAAVAFGNGPAVGFTIGGNYGRGYGNGDEATWHNTHVGSSQSQTTLISGGATTLRGAQVHGQGVRLEASELLIESLQDTATYKGKQEHASAQATFGYGFSAGGSYGQSKISADYASVTEQSGIFAGDDGYQINIGGHTNLIGGLITSTQKAEDENRNSFVTGTLSHSDIKNHAKYSGTAFGFGGGYSSAAYNQAVNGDRPNAYNEDGSKKPYGGHQGTAGKAVGFGHDSGSEKSVTTSSINTANTAITDEAGQQRLTGRSAEETIAAVRTGTTTDNAHERSGALENKFDKEKLLDELNLQVQVSREFQQNANTVIATYFEQKQAGLRKELDEAIQSGDQARIDEARAELYLTAYQRSLLETLVGLIAGAPGDVVITKGTLQLAAIKMREESMKNSLLFKGVVDVSDKGDGREVSNVSQESGWFDGRALGGVRITLDVLCGENNGRCKTETDEFDNPVIGSDGLPKLALDGQGRVQFTGDGNYPTLEALFSTRNKVTDPMYGITGGSQAVPGYVGSPGWGAYSSGSFFDMLVESFAGTHDFLGGQITGFYDEQGNTTRGRSNLTEQLVNAWAVTAVVPSAPFALSDLISPELMQILFKAGGK
jgi:filamentous hemagglutinin